MSNLAQCNVCAVKGIDFRIPWGDHIGPALMRAHFEDKHPEITLNVPKDTR